MKKQYLHLAVYRFDKCEGPVVTASLTVRENAIARETDNEEVGAMCLSCGYKQSRATELGVARHFPPIEWHSANTVDRPA